MSSRKAAAWTLSLMLVAQLGASRLASAANVSPAPSPQASNFALSDLTGTWYEIARIGKLKNLLCTDATASFTVSEVVPNEMTARFERTCPAGGHAIREGILTTTDAAHPSRLAFKYRDGIEREQLLNVIALDESIGYVVMGDDTRTSLFIYSRNPALDVQALTRIIKSASSEWGYDDNVAKDISCTKQSAASEADYAHCNNLTG